jgi:ankyrin repeat protein
MTEETLNDRLLDACRNNNLAAAADVLREGANPNLATTIDGSFALGFACANANPHLVALLLRAGADPNQSADSGYTALHYAAIVGGDNQALILMLLASGADANTKSLAGEKPSDLTHKQDTGFGTLETAAKWPLSSQLPLTSTTHRLRASKQRGDPERGAG